MASTIDPVIALGASSMVAELTFDEVMAGLRAGDQDAAAQVFGRYVDRLVALASCQFSTRFQVKADPEEVVQSVYQTFFRRNKAEQFVLADWDGVWALLATITVRKCSNRRDFWRARRRSVWREVGTGLDPILDDLRQAVVQGPTAQQATVLAETWEVLLARLTVRDREIAELSSQGYTQVEIGRRCRCAERTVGRVCQRVREILDEILAAESSG